MNSIAYEMGAVFLLAAMLMFGSAHGFIPRSVKNAGAPIVVGIALAGFLIWRFGPDLSANFRSTAEWSFPGSLPPSAELSPTKPAPAKPVAHRPEPAPRPVKPVVPIVQTILVREVPEAIEPAPPAVQPIAEAPPTDRPIEEADVKPAEESSGSSPYDSGVKRAVKSVGRFLHIGGKKNDPFAQ